MAKGDVSLKFSAETADYVQKVLAVRQAHEAAADGARKMGDAAGHAGEKMQEAGGKGQRFADVMREVGRSAAESLGVVTSAAGIVTAAIDTLIESEKTKLEQLEKRAEEFRNRTRTLTESLSASGQQASIGPVQNAVAAMSERDFGGEKFSETELTRAFSAISGELGERITADEKVNAVWA